MTAPLFDVDPPQGEAQACDRCSVGAWASLDGLRVLGWIAYDGFSFTGAVLRVRVCPDCQVRLRSASTSHPAAPHAEQLPLA